MAALLKNLPMACGNHLFLPSLRAVSYLGLYFDIQLLLSFYCTLLFGICIRLGVPLPNTGIMDKEVTTIQGLSELKGFKLVHLNVRSLHKKIDQVR